METIDVTTSEGLEKWEQANLTNVKENGELLSCWKQRHEVLVDWVKKAAKVCN